jgi:GNAT superfamily N-acetyltransferase
MRQLAPNDYVLASGLAAALPDHLAAAAVVGGATPGAVYVDDATHPRAALIIAHHRFMLCGDPSGAEFRRELRTLFADTILPEGRAAGKEAFGLYFSDGWGPVIVEDLLADPIPSDRTYYALPDNPPRFDWRAAIPEELRMVQVTRDLLEDPALENIDELLEELVSERESVDAFLQNSFGLCLRSDTHIVTWCLSEYNWQDRCEVGIATHPDYRRRGLATATGAAFVEDARARGCRSIGWHCLRSNVGSRATAEKIGFQNPREYPSYLVFFDRAVHLAVYGDICLQQDDASGAEAWLGRALATGSAPPWAYMVGACTAAQLGEAGLAMARLHEAVRRGYRARSRLETNGYLASLRTLPEWQRLMDEMA